MHLDPLFEIVEIAGEQLVIPVGDKADSFSGVVVLSEAAAFLLKNLDRCSSQKDLIETITAEYDVDYHTAEKDVERIIRDFKDMGIVV